MQSGQSLGSWSSVESNLSSVGKDLASGTPDTIIEDGVVLLDSMQSDGGFVLVSLERSSNVELRVVTSDGDVFCSEMHILFIAEAEPSVDFQDLDDRSFRDVENHVPVGFDLDVASSLRNLVIWPVRWVAPESEEVFWGNVVIWKSFNALSSARLLGAELNDGLRIWRLLSFTVDDQMEFVRFVVENQILTRNVSGG